MKASFVTTRGRMARLFSFTVSALTLAFCTVSGIPDASAQAAKLAAPHRMLLRANLKPGEVLRYELEASASFQPKADSEGPLLTPPRGPCDYSLAAIVTLRPQAADKDGNTPVVATYSEGRITSVKCALLPEADFQRRLTFFQSSPVRFRVGPHGETAVTHAGANSFSYWNGADLLRKVTQDLLQTQFSPLPVAEGDSWKPRGQFAYPKDYALNALELSAADLRFRNLLEVNGRTCAWITSKYVFSPLDIPASATASGGRVVPEAGNNAVAAVLQISLLLDDSTHHVGWLHRSQTIDNRLTLASPYDGADDPSAYEPDEDGVNPADGDKPAPDRAGNRDNPGRYPYMTFHFQEEARARILPRERSVEWLAALRRFEQAPEPENLASPVPTAKISVAGQLAPATKPAAVNRSTRVVDSDTLFVTPVGFTRFEKGLCRDVWFCATVSVALPGKVEISEDTPLRTVYLAKRGELLVSVAVGPALDRKYPGLTEEEELKKHAKEYLSNYVWLAVKPGIGTNFVSATLDGYPGLVTDFSATQRDLADMHGVLGLILTPWDKVVPVSCESDHAASAELQSLCEKIITSVSLRR